MSEKNTAGLIEDVVAFILSGDRRTTAQNLRTLLFNYLDSMPNNIDAGTIFQNELGYAGSFRPTSANAFATVDMLPGAPDLSAYIRLDGTTTATTGNIKIGNTLGLDWGGNSNILQSGGALFLSSDNSQIYRAYNGDYQYYNSSAKIAKFNFDSLTDTRNINFQDKDYTGVADITDITAAVGAYIPIAGNVGNPTTGNIILGTGLGFQYINGTDTDGLYKSTEIIGFNDGLVMQSSASNFSTGVNSVSQIGVVDSATGGITMQYTGNDGTNSLLSVVKAYNAGILISAGGLGGSSLNGVLLNTTGVTTQYSVLFPNKTTAQTFAMLSDIPSVTGFLSSTLASTKIFVGNSSNVAAGVNLTLNPTAGVFALSNAGVLTMPNATGSLRGLLTSADWNTFNGKQNALGYTPENVVNKATNFSTLNNTLYPTTQTTFYNFLPAYDVTNGDTVAISNDYELDYRSGTVSYSQEFGKLASLQWQDTSTGESVINTYYNGIAFSYSNTVSGNHAYVAANNSGVQISSLSGGNAVFSTALISGVAQTFQFPNHSGTFALTSDLGVYINGSAPAAVNGEYIQFADTNTRVSYVRRNNANSADIIHKLLFPDSSASYTYPTPASSGADTIALIGTAQTFTATNIFSVSQKFAAVGLTLNDGVSDKVAMYSSASNILNVGSGFSGGTFVGLWAFQGAGISFLNQFSSGTITGGQGGLNLTSDGGSGGSGVISMFSKVHSLNTASTNSGYVVNYTGDLTNATTVSTQSTGGLVYDVGAVTGGAGLRGNAQYWLGKTQLSLASFNGMQRGFYIGNATAAPTAVSASGLYSWVAIQKLNISGALQFPLSGGVEFKAQTNGRAGSNTLVSGSVTVANSSITANSQVIVTARTSGTAFALQVAYTAGTGFVISSANVADTRTVDWFIIERI